MQTYKQGLVLQVPGADFFNPTLTAPVTFDHAVYSEAMLTLNDVSGLLLEPVNIEYASVQATGASIGFDTDNVLADANNCAVPDAVATVLGLYYDPSSALSVPLVGGRYGFYTKVDASTVPENDGYLAYNDGADTIGSFNDADTLQLSDGYVPLGMFGPQLQVSRGFSLANAGAPRADTRRLTYAMYTPDTADNMHFSAYDDADSGYTFTFDVPFDEPPVVTTAVHPNSSGVMAVSILSITETVCRVRLYTEGGTPVRFDDTFQIFVMGATSWRS